MKMILLLIIILIFSVLINNYTDFGFLLNYNLTSLWLFFYVFLLPIGLMILIYNIYKNYTNLNKINLYVFIAYLFSLILSCINFINFRNLEILGDGATKYVMKIIFCLSVMTSLISFLFFRSKIKRNR